MNDDHSFSGTDSQPADGRERTYASLLRDIRDRFRLGGIPDWEASAEWLITDAMEVTRSELLSQGQRVARPEQVARLEAWVRRRLAREPVQYIVGHAEFCGLRLRVDRRVLIPRPETELLVEQAAEAVVGMPSPVRLLDIGTGSGCIALALAKMLPEAEVTASDYSERILELARENGAALRLGVRWIVWDVLGGAPPPDLGRFSLLVSNPPYIPAAEAGDVMPEVVGHEPHASLFVEGDPLTFYKAILEKSPDLLAPGGHVFFEVNPDFAAGVERLMRSEYGFASAGIRRDLAGLERIVWGCPDG